MLLHALATCTRRAFEAAPRERSPGPRSPVLRQQAARRAARATARARGVSSNPSRCCLGGGTGISAGCSTGVTRVEHREFDSGFVSRATRLATRQAFDVSMLSSTRKVVIGVGGTATNRRQRKRMIGTSMSRCGAHRWQSPSRPGHHPRGSCPALPIAGESCALPSRRVAAETPRLELARKDTDAAGLPPRRCFRRPYFVALISRLFHCMGAAVLARASLARACRAREGAAGQANRWAY